MDLSLKNILKLLLNKFKKKCDETYTINSQGTSNANKVMITDNDGNIIPVSELPANLIPSTGIPTISARALELSDGTLVKADDIALDDDVDKVLYNSTDFDEVVDKGNGTSTIFRQTGYFTINKNILKSWNKVAGVDNNYYCNTFIELPNAYYENEDKYYLGIANIPVGDSWGQPKISIRLTGNSSKNYGGIRIYNTKNSNEGLPDEIVIQYKLADEYRYEEKVITKQPLLNLNQNGTQFLRDEWEKGLNLLSDEIVISNETNGHFFKIPSDKTMKICVSWTDTNIKLWYGKYTKGTFPIKYSPLYNEDNIVSGKVIEIYSEFDYYLQVYNDTSIMLIPSECKIMLNEGDHPYSYQPYNANKHITNPQAELLLSEEEKSRNKFDKDTVNVDYVWSSQNGTLTSADGFFCSAKIKVEPNTTYTTTQVVGLSEYNSSDEFVKYTTQGNNQVTFTTSANTNYIGLVWNQNDNLDVNTFMCNEGSTLQPHTPYYGQIVHQKELNDSVNHLYEHTFMITIEEGSKIANSEFKILTSAEYVIDVDDTKNEDRDYLFSILNFILVNYVKDDHYQTNCISFYTPSYDNILDSEFISSLVSFDKTKFSVIGYSSAGQLCSAEIYSSSTNGLKYFMIEQEVRQIF